MIGYKEWHSWTSDGRTGWLYIQRPPQLYMELNDLITDRRLYAQVQVVKLAFLPHLQAGLQLQLQQPGLEPC